MTEKTSFSHLVPYEISSPEFLKRLQCEDAQEGELARLVCQVIGDPGISFKKLNLALNFHILIFLKPIVPKIQWFKEDGTEILECNSRYEQSYSLETGMVELVIKCALISDEMSYKCVASNKHGTAKTLGVLVVKGMSL